MSFGCFLIGIIMIVLSIVAMILTLRGYDWAIEKFEYFLFEADCAGKLGDRIVKRIMRG